MSHAIRCVILGLAGAAAAWLTASRLHEFLEAREAPDAKVSIVRNAMLPSEPGDFFAPLRELTESLEDAPPERLRSIYESVHAIEHTTWQRAYSLDLIICRWLEVDPAGALEALSKDAVLLSAFTESGGQLSQKWLASIRDHVAAMKAVTETIPLYHQVRLIEQLITLSNDAAGVAEVISGIRDGAIRLRAATAFVRRFENLDPAAVKAWAEKNPFLAAASGVKKEA